MRVVSAVLDDLRANGVEEASFHADGALASVRFGRDIRPPRPLATEDINARVETPEEQKARLDALLFASA